MEYLFSNEIVFRGHPDKVCDQISGAILDACLEQDKNTRAGIEVCGGKGKIFITGEITTKAVIDVEKIARRVLNDVGYIKEAETYEIIDNIGKQSADIALGVDIGGAGDQGMMFGYACKDTPEKLPTAMVILQKFAKEYDKLRGQYPKLLFPDGKAQITGVYDKEGKLLHIKTFLCSYQNAETKRNFTDTLLTTLIWTLCVKNNIDIPDKILFNPTGKFLIGGFEGDAGLTGRKIVVDAYQSFANVGGGCMNGKDPTKVDFSASHKAREIAKEVLDKIPEVKWCEVQISYAIGLAVPLSIYIKTNLGYMLPSHNLYLECKPANITKDLDLLNISYEALAQFGHFTN